LKRTTATTPANPNIIGRSITSSSAGGKAVRLLKLIGKSSYIL